MALTLREHMGTVKAMALMRTLFAIILLAMEIWTQVQWVLIVAVILAGAVLSTNNTLITTAVMNAAPVERSTAAAYSFLRFLGVAVAPYTAGKLAQWSSPHVPFLTGVGFAFLSVVFILLNYRHVHHVDEAMGAHESRNGRLGTRSVTISDGARLVLSR